MRILFQVYQNREFHDLGIIDTDEGEIHKAIVDGFQDWIEDELSMRTTPDMDQPKELLKTYEGPHIIAKPVDHED